MHGFLTETASNQPLTYEVAILTTPNPQKFMNFPEP